VSPHCTRNSDFWAACNWDLGLARQLFWIESERLKLPEFRNARGLRFDAQGRRIVANALNLVRHFSEASERIGGRRLVSLGGPGAPWGRFFGYVYFGCWPLSIRSLGEACLTPNGLILFAEA
jgi:hypothetical protein